jgi:hypothetical protein
MKNRFLSLALIAGVAATFTAGCSQQGSESRIRTPRDPNRTVARMVANVTSLTEYADENMGARATFRAILYDAAGEQFYGPTVVLDGEPADIVEGPSTIYRKTNLPYAAGASYAVNVQNFEAVTPPAPAPIRILSPAPEQRKTDELSRQEVQVFNQPAGQPLTVTWTGGDSAEPVYIFVVGTPDGLPARRFFPRMDPAQHPIDPENYGLPIANTGTFTIPAQLEERRVAADGSVSVQTVSLFANPNRLDAQNPERRSRQFWVYVVQRRTNVAQPIQFSVNSVGVVIADVLAQGA